MIRWKTRFRGSSVHLDMVTSYLPSWSVRSLWRGPYQKIREKKTKNHFPLFVISWSRVLKTVRKIIGLTFKTKEMHISHISVELLRIHQGFFQKLIQGFLPPGVSLWIPPRILPGIRSEISPNIIFRFFKDFRLEASRDSFQNFSMIFFLKIHQNIFYATFFCSSKGFPWLFQRSNLNLFPHTMNNFRFFFQRFFSGCLQRVILWCHQVFSLIFPEISPESWFFLRFLKNPFGTPSGIPASWFISGFIPTVLRLPPRMHLDFFLMWGSFRRCFSNVS